MIALLLSAEAFGRQALPFALNFAWQSSVVVAIAWGAAYLVRRGGAGDKRAVWISAFFVCIGCPVVTPLLRQWGIEQPVLQRFGPGDLSEKWSEIRWVRISAVKSHNRAAKPAAPFADEERELQAGWLAAGNVIARLREKPTAAPRDETVVVDMAAVVFGALYGLGMLCFAVRFGAGIAWLGWVRLRSRSLQRPDLEPILADLCRQLRLRHLPRVCVSRHVNSPSVFGLANPTIMIPAMLGSWLTSSQLRYVLAHELSHIKARDYVFGMVFRTVQVALFFQPMLALLINRLRDESELLADEVAVRAGSHHQQDPLTYAELLVHLAEWSRPSFAEKFAAANLIFSHGLLTRRVDAILTLEALPPARPLIRRRMVYPLGSMVVLCFVSSTTLVVPAGVDDSFQRLPETATGAASLPPFHMSDPFTFEVETIWAFPDEVGADFRPQGMTYDQELRLVTVVGDTTLFQLEPDRDERAALRVRVGPVRLSHSINAVALLEPALARKAAPGHAWAAGGALVLSPTSGKELWLVERKLERGKLLRPVVVPAPEPELGGAVVGLTSTYDTVLPGDLARVVDVDQPGQIDFLQLRSEGSGIVPRFERHVPSYTWDLRERRRNEGIVAPLTGVAVDPFEELLFVVDAGNPEPEQPPGGRLQAFSYVPDYPRHPETGPFHSRIWSSLIDKQIGIAGKHWPGGMTHAFHDICFSRTGERMYILYSAAQGPNGAAVPAGIAVMRRAHIHLRIAKHDLVVGETSEIVLLAGVNLPAEEPLLLLSSSPRVVMTALMPASKQTDAGLVRSGVVRALAPGNAVVAVYSPALPGEAEWVTVHQP